MSTHAFRVVYFEAEKDRYEADRPVYEVTRIPALALAALLSPQEGTEKAPSTSSAAEQAAALTLQQLRVRDDTILECALDVTPLPLRREHSPPRRSRRYRS